MINRMKEKGKKTMRERTLNVTAVAVGSAFVAMLMLFAVAIVSGEGMSKDVAEFLRRGGWIETGVTGDCQRGWQGRSDGWAFTLPDEPGRLVVNTYYDNDPGCEQTVETDLRLVNPWGWPAPEVQRDGRVAVVQFSPTHDNGKVQLDVGWWPETGERLTVVGLVYDSEVRP